MKPLYIYIYLGLLLCCVRTTAQSHSVPPLERQVSINVSNIPLDEFLKELSKEGNFSFAYNPSIVHSQKRVSAFYKNKSVRYILDITFAGSVSYKSKGNHVILTSAQNKSTAQKTPKYFKVTGYVIDKSTSARLSEVSIYEEKTLHSTLSDDFGYFTIQLPYNNPDPILKVEKRGYQDSTIVIYKKEIQSMEVAINPDRVSELVVEVPEVDKVGGVADSMPKLTTVLIKGADSVTTTPEDAPLDVWLVLNKKLKAHLQNISDTIFRTVQISFLPTISTNRLISGNVTNEYSINMLMGYARGVRKLEMGGLMNIDRSDVGKCQLAGLFNLVGGKVTGFQAAGLMNFVKDTVKGCQAAGLMNFNYRHTQGCQMAGLSNHARSMEGLQMGGLYNIALNTRGTQLAGLFNAAMHVKGVQGAGLFNTAMDVNGVQAAGLFNFALDVEGTQVSGLLNVARKVKGTQIGFINIADSCSGIPIGFLSIVRNGYHKIEISTDEVLAYNVALRMGVHKFHNLFGVSTNFKGGSGFAWSYSYGIGTSFKLHKKLYLDLDLISAQLNADSHAAYLSLNNRLNISLDWQIAKNVSLAFGPSINSYVVDNRLYDQSAVYRNLGRGYPSFFYSPGESNIDARSWIGWKAAIRFL